jgi:hypothetical protein
MYVFGKNPQLKFYLMSVDFPIGCDILLFWKQLNPTSDKVYQLLTHGRWFSPITTSSNYRLPPQIIVNKKRPHLTLPYNNQSN